MGELQLKIVAELKLILKNQNLPVSGNKQQLVNRILEHQPRKQKTYENYLDLLPGDITRELDKYRLLNEPNNKALASLLNFQISTYNFIYKVSYFKSSKTSFKKFFLANNFNIEITTTNRGTGKFIIKELPIISNKILQDLIFLMIDKIKTSYEVINQILKDSGCNFRIVGYWIHGAGRQFEIINI